MGSRYLPITLLSICLILTLALSQCGKGSQTPLNSSPEENSQQTEEEFWGKYPELGEGRVPYTVLPIDLNYIDDIIPLGHLNPLSGHSIPTEHIYLVLTREELGGISGFSQQVKAPAEGVITNIIYTKWAGYDDYAIIIRHTGTFLTRFNHLSEVSQWILDKTGPLQESWDGNEVYVSVKAGDIIGKTSVDYGQSAALDMGAYDKDEIHYIHPEKFWLPSQHAICPLDNFTDELKAQLYQKVQRIKEPRCGQYDYDEKGKLVGIWILEGKETWEDDGYKYQLAFVYDSYDPQYLRVSLGEFFGNFVSALAGGYLAAVKGNGPDFKNVDVNSGEVVYKLIPISREGAEFFGDLVDQTKVDATLLVKMLSEEKIKVEVFSGEVENPSFTQNAKIFIRL